MTMATVVSFAQGFGPLALAPMFPALMKAFDRGLADVVQFTGVCILVLGFSNFLWYETDAMIHSQSQIADNGTGSRSKQPLEDGLY